MALKRLFVLAVVLAVCLVLANAALAQVSPNFDLGWHVLSGGGGIRNSPHYRLGDTLGQWAEGPSASANYKLSPGFWYGVPVSHKAYLPLVRR
jgi:hypothetical protein